MKWLEICSSHFMKWLKLKIIHVLLILNILRAYIDFTDSLIFVDDFYKKAHILRKRNKIVEFRQVSFFHAFYAAFILNSLGKGYVLSMNANDEGAEGYYRQLRLVMLYSCFEPLPHNFILNKTFILILYNQSLVLAPL